MAIVSMFLAPPLAGRLKLDSALAITRMLGSILAMANQVNSIYATCVPRSALPRRPMSKLVNVHSVV